MPYIITTSSKRHREPGTVGVPKGWHVNSRRAVATLEEAQRVVLDILDPHDPHTAQPAVLVPESGGTVGPLPDGTVIEVEQVGWVDLCAEAAASSGIAEHMPEREWQPRIIDAFNAREATS